MLILLSTDLMVASRVQGAAQKLGAELRTVSTAAQTAEQLRLNNESAVIIDLAAAPVDIAALVEELRSGNANVRVIAFGPHVHANRLAAATEAGCNTVVSRGQFFAQAEELLGNSRGVAG